MLITAAEERKKGLTALYIDGEYAVSVDSLTFAGSVFRVGSEITDEQLYELIRLSDVNRAKEKALYLIEYRPRSRKEVEDKLVPLFGEDASEHSFEVNPDSLIITANYDYKDNKIFVNANYKGEKDIECYAQWITASGNIYGDLKFDIPDGGCTIPTPNENGLYLLRVVTDGKSRSFKFVINK